MGGSEVSSALSSVVHIIQVALTPVFLLSGIATLLNVFSTRLARVADQVDALTKTIDDGDAAMAETLVRRLAYLHRRTLALDAAVGLAAAGGTLTCTTVLALFVGEAGGVGDAAVLFVTFGLAIVCTLGSIGAYTAEMLLASQRIRAEVIAGQRLAERD